MKFSKKKIIIIKTVKQSTIINYNRQYGINEISIVFYAIDGYISSRFLNISELLNY